MEVRQPSTTLSSLYVNGAWVSEHQAETQANLLADSLGRNVRLVYNDTERANGAGFFDDASGRLADLFHVACGKLSSFTGRICEPAVDALAAQLFELYSSSDNPRIDIHAHSQGAVLVKNALSLLRSRLGIGDESSWSKLLTSRFRISIYGDAEHGLPATVTKAYLHSNDVVHRGVHELEKLLEGRMWSPDLEPLPHVTTAHEGSFLTAHAFESYVNNIPEFFIAEHGDDGRALADAFLVSLSRREFAPKVYQEILAEVKQAGGMRSEEFFGRFDALRESVKQ